MIALSAFLVGLTTQSILRSKSELTVHTQTHAYMQNLNSCVFLKDA